MAGMMMISNGVGINKIVKFAASMHRSVPRTQSFHRWQKASGFKPLQPITISKTRWHGYLDSIVRHLEIHSRIESWILDNNDPSLNTDALHELLLDRYEMGQVASIAYVLSHLRPYDSIA